MSMKNMIINKKRKIKKMNHNLVPVVVEKSERGFERSYDIYSRLLKDNIVFITGPITDAVANTFIAQMLFLENQDPKKDINVYINSQGGSAYAGFAIYDTIRHVKNDVSTINVGLAASAGALILCAGTKGKRFVLPGSYSMIHQTVGGAQGQATDVEITAKHMVELKQRYAEAIAKNSNQDLKKVMDDIERDSWMSAEETVEYKIADKILNPKK